MNQADDWQIIGSCMRLGKKIFFSNFLSIENSSRRVFHVYLGKKNKHVWANGEKIWQQGTC